MATRRGPDNSVRVAMSGKINTVSNWATIFHCQLTTGSAITQASLDTWLGSFATAFEADLGPYMRNESTITLAKCVCYTPGGGQLSSASVRTGVGSRGVSALDNATAAVVSWQSAVYWRGGKPRTYLPAPATADVTNGDTLGATYRGLLQTAGGTFRTAVNALTTGTIASTTMGFVSFRSANADRPVPLFFPITGALAHTRLATQRRRLGRWQQ